MTVTSPVVCSDPDILGSAPVFVGTRVPVRTLLEDPRNGDSLHDCLEDFPSVSHEHAVAGFELANSLLASCANRDG